MKKQVIEEKTTEGNFVASSIDEVINVFKEQEDEIKEKLKNQIIYKNNDKRESNIFNHEQNANILNENRGLSDGGIIGLSNNKESFKITGDTSNLSTSSLDNQEDIYFEDLVTIAERVGENSVVLKHVDRATLNDLEEDKDYTILLEWDKVIPDDAKVEDIDKIFANGLNTFISNVKNKEELLFNSLVIKKDNWIENLEEDKRDYLGIADSEKKNLTEIDEELFETNGSVLSISDILNQRNNILEKVEEDNFIEDFTPTSSLEEDLAGLENFFGLENETDEATNVITIPTNDLLDDDLLLENLETKSTEDLIALKEKLQEKTSRLLEQKQVSLTKVEEYRSKAETIDNMLKTHFQREDGTLYLGQDFFSKYSVEEQGEVLKEFTFKAFQNVNEEMKEEREVEKAIPIEEIFEDIKSEQENKQENLHTNAIGL